MAHSKSLLCPSGSRMLLKNFASHDIEPQDYTINEHQSLDKGYDDKKPKSWSYLG